MKDGIALEFLLDLLSTLKAEKGGNFVVNVIKKSGVESRLLEFFPGNNQVSLKPKVYWGKNVFIRMNFFAGSCFSKPAYDQ